MKNTSEIIKEIQYSAMLEFESICEEILVKRFSTFAQEHIQEHLLDEAQRIFEKRMEVEE